MNKKKIMKERHELLTRIQGEMQENYTAALIREPENENDPPILSIVFDGLGMEHDDAFGEFYFLPLPDGEARAQHFSAVITIADDIKEDHLSELFEAMSYINFALPCGAYSIDSQKRFMAFRMTAPLPIDIDPEELYKEVNIVIGNAVAITDVHMDILLKVMAGEMTVEDVKKAL
ncbi:MAG: hypothetical protein J6O61_10555 [Butyrivibrio sp.]|uniref:hypothetical protein n=1 Tax=Butyrivibrio sp. TaxID=28121 RepID=UPI001B149EAE|nr:hypothetical protein [Butyrivibrio sp.]MBO6241250.1 hypothetical protein [Butyrivibrio sp.]